MKKYLAAILVLATPVIVFADAVQSAEQVVKTALDCKGITNFSVLDKNVKNLSSGTFNGDRGKVYKLTTPIKYGNLNIGAVFVEKDSQTVIGYLQESMPIPLAGIKKRLPSSSALLKSKYHDEVASYSRDIQLKKNDILTSNLTQIVNGYHIECMRSQF